MHQADSKLFLTIQLYINTVLDIIYSKNLKEFCFPDLIGKYKLNTIHIK